LQFIGFVTALGFIDGIAGFVGFVIFIAYFFALGEQRQTLYDKICGTTVYHVEDIQNINIPMNNFIDVFKNKLEKIYNNNININIIILYILNKYHNIPILIYDLYDTIIYIIDNKLISLDNKDNYKPNECFNIKISLNKIITIYVK
jgi:hypothetical protein